MTQEDFESYKSKFPIFEERPRISYLANCSASPLSTPVRDAVENYLESRNRNGPDWEAWVDTTERSKSIFAKLIGAGKNEVSLSSSLSDSLSNIAACLVEGQQSTHVVTTVDEFPTVGHVWNANQISGKCDVTFVAASREDGVYSIDDIKSAVTEKTSIICVHHVSYYNGAKQDLVAISEFAHSIGAYFIVDAYQSIGTCQIDVVEAGVDVLIAGNLKYLLGMPGTAYMYVKREIASKLVPGVTGWFGRVNPFNFDATHFDYAESAGRFNTGTPPVIAAYGSLAGMELIVDAGLAAIERKINTLSEFAIETAEHYKLDFASPVSSGEKGAITALYAVSPNVISGELSKDDIVVAPRKDVIRLAHHFFTTEAEIDRAMCSIKKLTA